MIIYRKNLHHTHKLQKQAYNKVVKLKGYISSDKVWFNSKYIQTKKNHNLEAKYFGLFQILYLVGNQAYKLKMLRK